MKQTFLLALGFSTLASVAHADLRTDLTGLCTADKNMTAARCECQINALMTDKDIDQKFLTAMVEGLKNKNTEPLMQMMQADQEGANKFGKKLGEITDSCGK